MYLTLTEIKEHLIVQTDFDDDYLLGLEAAAEDAAAKSINRNLSETLVDGKLPAALKMMLLLMIGTWYANRESVKSLSVHEVPFSFRFLGDLYRRY